MRTPLPRSVLLRPASSRGSFRHPAAPCPPPLLHHLLASLMMRARLHKRKDSGTAGFQWLRDWALGSPQDPSTREAPWLLWGLWGVEEKLPSPRPGHARQVKALNRHPGGRLGYLSHNLRETGGTERGQPSGVSTTTATAPARQRTGCARDAWSKEWPWRQPPFPFMAVEVSLQSVRHTQNGRELPGRDCERRRGP